MKKLATIIFCALTLLAPSLTFAHDRHHCHDDGHHCHHHDVDLANFHGSFVALRGSVEAIIEDVTPDDAILDQFIFHADGTVYQNQTNAIVFPITFGSFIPAVGTWAPSGEKHIVATIISAYAAAIPGGGDINLSEYNRTTYRIKIISRDRLLIERAVQKTFALDENPLEDSGTVVSDSNPNLYLNRVQVVRDDL